MSEEKLKYLQERKKKINAQILRLRGELSEYEGAVKFPVKYSLRAEGKPTRRKKSTSFKQHNLPHTTLSLNWSSCEDVRFPSLGYGVTAYLGNKLKPKSGFYLVEITITPLEEEADVQ